MIDREVLVEAVLPFMRGDWAKRKPRAEGAVDAMLADHFIVSRDDWPCQVCGIVRKDHDDLSRSTCSTYREQVMRGGVFPLPQEDSDE